MDSSQILDLFTTEIHLKETEEFSAVSGKKKKEIVTTYAYTLDFKDVSEMRFKGLCESGIMMIVYHLFV